MRKVQASFSPVTEARVHRVITYANVAAEWAPDLHLLVLTQETDEKVGVEGLQEAGLPNISWVQSAELLEGDIVVPRPAKNEAVVLFRESDTHHALFMTNRCNSHCLMCSQPPTPADDSWLVKEAIDTIQHMRTPPLTLGLTGGEPLLLRANLRRILDAVAEHLPGTHIEVLTNGRLFSDGQVAEQILAGLSTPVRWLVPLYGHADFVHDFVVQAPGAFDETLAGLMALQAQQQDVQLRVVLIEPVLRVLPELAGFIGRNLPFVREVALMGCEPIGFALANRDLCEVDLAQWSDTLALAARQLRRHEIPHLMMNAPLCALPQVLWPIAHRSISDWKNVYATECEECSVKASCSGLFAWHERGWKPAPLRTIGPTEATA